MCKKLENKIKSQIKELSNAKSVTNITILSFSFLEYFSGKKKLYIFSKRWKIYFFLKTKERNIRTKEWNFKG